MGKSSTTKQTNEPPAWAKPLLTKAASDGMDLYDSGVGYNVYSGPTQAPLSDVTLGGMNSLLAATGYRGSPISNESINAQVPDIRSMIEQAAQRNAQAQAQAQAAKAKTSTASATQSLYDRGENYNVSRNRR